MPAINSSYTSLRKAILTRQTTCVEQVEHHLSIIKKNTHLHVFLTVYEQEALQQARVIDQKIKNGTAGKLAGMVVGLKDVFSYKDHALQAGSKILNGFIAQYTATAVQRLLDEDAIIIGRQNCDEFAMGSSNENSAFGPTLHFADPTRVPGGSSGASAVAVATDMCQVSLGSDTGGSVRQPASFCGVIGLKPTYSRISRHGLVAYGSSFDCVGIIAKTIADIALVLEIIAGKDDYDSTVSQKEVPSFTHKLANAENKKYKIAYISETFHSTALQPAVKNTLAKQVDILKSMGHHVACIDFPLMEFVLPTYYLLATAEASANLARYDGVRYGHRSAHSHDLESLYKKSRTEGFGPEVKRRILLGTFVLSANYYDTYYSKAQKVRRLIRDKTKEIFKDHHFLIMPVSPTTAFLLGQHTQDPLEMYLADLFSVQANVAGVPAIALPGGKDENGLPVGFQLMADDFQESHLLHLANVLMDAQNESGI